MNVVLRSDTGEKDDRLYDSSFLFFFDPIIGMEGGLSHSVCHSDLVQSSSEASVIDQL